MLDSELNMQFCLKNVGKMRVFILEQMAHELLRAICSKLKTRVLLTVLGQKMLDIEQNMQFYPKNVRTTRVFEQNGPQYRKSHLLKNKNRRFTDIFGTKFGKCHF